MCMQWRTRDGDSPQAPSSEQWVVEISLQFAGLTWHDKNTMKWCVHTHLPHMHISSCIRAQKKSIGIHASAFMRRCYAVMRLMYWGLGRLEPVDRLLQIACKLSAVGICEMTTRVHQHIVMHCRLRAVRLPCWMEEQTINRATEKENTYKSRCSRIAVAYALGTVCFPAAWRMTMEEKRKFSISFISVASA